MGAARTSGGSIFLVEDEVMIRMMVADMLEELGYNVAAEAGEIGDALKLAQSVEFDLAILDVNVNGKVISPVADVIAARNRPFIFATGYGSSGLPAEYRDRPALQKPFQIETLGGAIEHALKRPAASRTSSGKIVRFTSASRSAPLKTPRRCGPAATASPRQNAPPAPTGRCPRRERRPWPAVQTRSRSKDCRGHRAAGRFSENRDCACPAGLHAHRPPRPARRPES